MLWAIGAWLASGLIGGLWSKRKGQGMVEGMRVLSEYQAKDTNYSEPLGGLGGVNRDKDLVTGEEESSPVFLAALSGPFALYNAWKQQRHSK